MKLPGTSISTANDGPVISLRQILQQFKLQARKVGFWCALGTSFLAVIGATISFTLAWARQDERPKVVRKTDSRTLPPRDGGKPPFAAA